MNSVTYLDKITSAHITKAKYMAWLKELLDMLCEIGNVFEKMNADFSVDSAVGAQLDVVGSFAGASRSLPYTSQYSGMLDDEDYRAYIKSKILQNTWDGTNESLPSLWQTVYPQLKLSYVDGQDMTMTVTITGDVSNAMTELIQSGLVVPSPAGVHQDFIIQSGQIQPAEVGLGTGIFEYGNDQLPNQAE